MDSGESNLSIVSIESFEEKEEIDQSIQDISESGIDNYRIIQAIKKERRDKNIAKLKRIMNKIIYIIMICSVSFIIYDYHKIIWDYLNKISQIKYL